jgi:hypothetical protein
MADCTLVTSLNFGLLHEKLGGPSNQTSARVAVRVPQVPRPLFGLSLAESSCPAVRGRPTSRDRCSMTTGPIWFWFEAMGSRNYDCTSVHFAELWPTYAKCFPPHSTPLTRPSQHSRLVDYSPCAAASARIPLRESSHHTALNRLAANLLGHSSQTWTVGG